VRLSVNGEVTDVAEDLTVAALVELVAPAARGVAVSVDREVVPRSQWAATALAEGARVEVLAATAGG
jgi:sulfur carrier protein